MIVRHRINRILADVEAAIPPDGKRDYFRLHRNRFAMLLAAIPLDAGRRVLEIGVNPGLFTQALVRAGYQVCGTDLFPAHRAELWHRLGVDVRRWNIDTEPPPYSPESFDLIIFSEVIEHLSNPPIDALATIRDLLVPGGYLLISTPNQFYLKSRLRVLADVLLMRPFERDDEFQRWAQLKAEERYYTHSRLYSMRQLCWMLDQAGLVVRRRVYGDPWERVGLEWSRLLRYPHRWLAKALLWGVTRAIPPARSMLLVVAQRPRTCRQARNA
ncbi:MAG: class I SAM-dependent methyltransferase [Roseiflexus sp.]|nr:class I SAM-dependent methyltransferase [Roseiflexus sp.]MCS7289595.1 class I SAM-dependent methyltransferase [Roseiflexus sp.]MDW8148615.1 class I SAM-dependent methyltransferase [Roseiflexaceae bacterium]MDW8231736.1 class I SAM-dependent methyltransferase [Roseiflexaceae bacterium]